MNQIFFAVLGATLAGLAQLGAGVIIVSYRDKRKGRSESGNFALVVGTELESTSRQLEKLKASLHDRGFFAFTNINSLGANVSRLMTHIAELYKISENPDLQRDFMMTVTEIADLSQDLSGIENYMANETEKFKIEQQGTGISQSPADHVIQSELAGVDKRKIDETKQFVVQQRNSILVQVVDARRRCDEVSRQMRLKFK